jgi:O-antigen ligase
LLAAGGLAGGLLLLFLGFNFRSTLKIFWLYILMLGVFLTSAFFASINSSSPFTQNIYGAYGRNTGFLTYFLLSLISLGALNLRTTRNFGKIILGLQIAGIVNTVYCLWVLLFGDFLSWNNPYGEILGLFGNPNFIGAFLGIFITTLAVKIADPETTWKVRLTSIIIAAVAFYEVVMSHAVQGIVVTSGGIAIVGFFFIRAKFRSPLVQYPYLLAVGSLGYLALMGALQKGPFDFVYKTSVSLRGAYWNAGISMGRDNPLTGIGMDSYGDWYRRARSENAATVLPGPKTITNAAHNVVIDFFAFGGWPLLLAYVGLILLAAVSIVKVMVRSREYEPTFVAMTAAWTCYQVQSIISINQIGLAIWGWLLTAALISYEFATRNTSSVQSEGHQPGKGKNIKGKPSTGIFSPQLLAGLGIVVGLIISSPPMSADSKWRSALNSNNATQILAALEPSYLNPSNSQRYAQAVQLFANSNLMDQAREVALDAIEFNPEYFDAWKIFYALPNTSEEEKAEALKNMKRLDPLNPDVLAN